MSLPPNLSKYPINYGETLLIARRGKVLLVALNRKRTKNAFNDAQYLDLVSVLEAVSNDESVYAIVLTGMGDYFSSGADLTEWDFSSDDDDQDRKDDGAKKGVLHKPAGKFMMALLKFPKVFCAAVNGPAVGIGVTLLLHCDLVYCTPSSTFWVPFTRIALVPEFASSVTFVDTMGLSNANQLLLLGKKIDAEKAVRCHICSDVVEGYNKDGDAFSEFSIGSKLCVEIDSKLLSLSQGEKTSKIFVDMVRSRRRQYYEQVTKNELVRLDSRIDSGEVLEAAMSLDFSRSKL